MTTQFQKEMLDAYLECALWADGEELPEGHTIHTFNKESRDEAAKDCARFLFAYPQAEEFEPEQLGHDLWLTRNHHGAGFWDRTKIYGELADDFTHFAHTLGERYLFANDQNTVSIE